MTVQSEEPDLVVAVCDGCGERHILDLYPGASEDSIKAALEARGWRREKPEKQRFGFGTPYRETYERDFCGDCQTDEPGPQPIFRHQPARPASVGAFANDPCDEWPRALVFAAVGLRPDCGHPPATPPERCGYCERGYPIGSTQPGWRR